MTDLKANVKLLTQIQFLLIGLLAVILAFKFPAAFIVLPLLSFFLTLIINQYNFSLTILRVSKKGYLLTILFGIHFLWFLAVIVETKSFSYLERTLPFLLFPLMISSIRIDNQNLKTVLTAFIYAVILSYSLSLVAAIYHYIYSIPRWGRASDFFFHEQFTAGLFDIHPTYYSLLGCLATLFVFHIATKWHHFLIVLALTFFIVLINARIIIFVQVLLIFSFVVKYFYKGFTWRKLGLTTAIIFIFLILIQIGNSIYDYPHRKMMLDAKSSWDRSYAKDISDGDGGLVTRFAIWRAAVDVIKRYPIFGVGLDNEKEVLATVFRKSEVPYLTANANNAHNQVLSYLISFGLIGFILLSLFFFMLLKEAYSKKSWLYFEFLAIFFIVSMTESIFNRGLGIAIFAFFNSLLLLKYVNNDE
jgi:O-antigen ligase